MSINPVSVSSIKNIVSFKRQENSSVVVNKQDNKTKLQKAMPYIAGAAVLAASGYAFRGRIAKILHKSPETFTKKKYETPKINIIGTTETPEVIKQTSAETVKLTAKSPSAESQILAEPPKSKMIEVSNQVVHTKTPEASIQTEVMKPDTTEQITSTIETASKVPEQFKGVELVDDVVEEPKFKEIFTHFDNEGKPVYETIEMPSSKGASISAYKEMLDSVNLNDEKIISKIENIKISEQENITRILNENTHNGYVDIPMMKKVATDYMNDTQRGENRFHQAADLLEQTHIRAFVKGDAKEKSGMSNLVTSFSSDPVLYKAYQNMPKEESAVRLNYLKEHDLKSETYKDSMSAQGFFDKAFSRLVEKYQMKRYNEAHGIQA